MNSLEAEDAVTTEKNRNSAWHLLKDRVSHEFQCCECKVKSFLNKAVISFLRGCVCKVQQVRR